MPILLLLLVAMGVEVTVMVLVGQAIGVLPTILLLILVSVVGMWLLRREGSRKLRAVMEAVQNRQVPHREVADGALIATAGVLILVPGFVSDVLALALLFPPTRAIVARRLARRSEERVRSAQQGGAFVVDSVILNPDDAPRGESSRGPTSGRLILPPE